MLSFHELFIYSVLVVFLLFSESEMCFIGNMTMRNGTETDHYCYHAMMN